jgi:hypothetical protein
LKIRFGGGPLAVSDRHQSKAHLSPRKSHAGCAYPRVRSPFITSIFLSQALELGNKDDKVDNKDLDKQEQFDSMSDNTSDGTDDNGDNIRHDKR